MTVTTGVQRDAAPAGVSLIAGAASRAGDDEFRAIEPATGTDGPTVFADATADEVAAAARAAREAFEAAGPLAPAHLKDLLDEAAAELERGEEAIVSVLMHETGLPEPRLRGEFVRTTTQLRFLGEVVTEGSCFEATIDPPDREHPVLPRPDLRRVLVPIGPVAVFGASNFPLAYSVAGGDTAAALAVGCPVVVKAHPSHPGASELCGGALNRAVRTVGLPPGWFSLLQGRSHHVGEALVTAPEIQAVGFTGSLAGGRALHDLASARPDPIPVYAEMGSINPVVVTRGALAARAADIAERYLASITTDGGQFCTKPGLLFLPDGDAADAMIADLGARVAGLGPCRLVNERVRDALVAQVERIGATPGVSAVGNGDGTGAGLTQAPVLFSTDVATYLANPHLRDEAFGPSSLVVRYADEDELITALRTIDGSLSAALHIAPDELGEVAAIQAELTQRVGRLVFNSPTTGLAVTHATHHSGPYPASTSVLHTSVGATAVRRFLRPIAYQDAPSELLPPALRDDNPLGITRRIDGRWTAGQWFGTGPDA